MTYTYSECPACGKRIHPREGAECMGCNKAHHRRCLNKVKLNGAAYSYYLCETCRLTRERSDRTVTSTPDKPAAQEASQEA